MNEQKISIPSDKKHISELDVMRIILMMFVIFGHARYLRFVPYNPDPGGGWYAYGFLSYADKLVDFSYSFHMPLFFVLSGMVAFLTQQKTFVSFDRMVINKFKRLIIPYILWGLFWMIPLRAIAHVFNSENINRGITSLFTLTNGSHLWFLPALFGVFICFYPFYLVYRRTGSFMAVGILSFIFTNIMGLVPIQFLNFQKVLLYFIYFATGFVVGGLLYVNNESRIKISFVGLLSISLTSVILLILAQFRYALNLTPLNVLVMGVCIYSFSLMITRYTKITDSKVYDLINRNCMRIYLFHDPLNFPILFVAYKTGFLAYHWGCYLMYFLRTVGIASVSLALSVLIEQLKSVIHRKKLTDRLIPVCTICLLVALIFVSEMTYNMGYVANLNDVNWTRGVRNNGTEIVLTDTKKNHNRFIENTPVSLKIDGIEYPIVSVVDDSNGYYRVAFENANVAQKFAYPAVFQILYD